MFEAGYTDRFCTAFKILPIYFSRQIAVIGDAQSLTAKGQTTSRPQLSWSKRGKWARIMQCCRHTDRKFLLLVCTNSLHMRLCRIKAFICLLRSSPRESDCFVWKTAQNLVLCDVTAKVSIRRYIRPLCTGTWAENEMPWNMQSFLCVLFLLPPIFSPMKLLYSCSW